jgi:NTP pyrophosphatase (non-canonical NTP hydrolase)
MIEFKEMTLQEIVDECGEDSRAWFPAFDKELAFQTLCLLGEAGEFANLLKKVVRGSLLMDENVHLMLCEELTDVFTYLCLMASTMGFDLSKAYQAKREINAERFGGKRVNGS